MKILIFGTGFIATNLIEFFSEKYKNVKFIVLHNNHKLEISRNNIKEYNMDCDIDKLFSDEKPEYMILLHGNSFVSSNTNTIQSINDNVLKISSFLELLYEKKLYHDIKKIIIVGSASEYGKLYNEPIKEDFELHPTSVYGLSKILLFNVTKFFIEKKLPIVYIRQFNTIGIGQRDSFVFPYFIKNIILIEKGKASPILKVGDLSQERDFLDVRDTCSAYDILLHKGSVGEVYNVGSGQHIKISELLNKIIDNSKLDVSDIKIESNVDLFPKEKSLTKRLYPNIDKIKSLGFIASYSIEDSIKDATYYWRENV